MLCCMFMATKIVAENTETINVTFSGYPSGSQYAKNEKHDLGGGLVIYTTLCHFTEQLRIYSSSTYNGYVVSDPLSGSITRMSFRMGHKKDILNIYGSTDKENWTLIKGIETTSTSYMDYVLDFPVGKGYTCFKLDVKGDQQIRIESMSVTYIKSDDSEEDEVITISAPIFTPVSTSYSTESLDVTIEAAEGCEVYYTKDGTTPSYISPEEYVGTKGRIVTIYASEAQVTTLQAIAVDPATGKCSSVSSATYTYVEINNDGTKTKPYTVAEVKAKKSDLYSSSVYVKGTIYGTMVNNDIKNITTSDFVPSNIVIGDKDIHIPVQLKDGTQIRDINLYDHPYLKGKELLVKGQMAEYGGSIGVIDPIAADFKITFDVPINSYGYATLYLDMSVSVPSGTTAYYCILEDNYAKLLPVGSIIPSETGVIIESTPNTICTLTYTTMKNSNEEHISAENLLVGYSKEYPVGEDGYAYYALNVKNNKLGFYIPQTATDKANPAMGFTAKANKAYLRVPAEQKAEMFVIQRRSDEDAIVPVTYMRDDTIYDLLGRVVYSPTPGIYIRNGKKFVIK